MSTQFGHVIAMFIKDKIDTTDFYELIDIAKDEDLILNFVHPGRSLEHSDLLADKCDLIEVINGHSRITQNIHSKFIQSKANKPQVAGSDAHFS